MFRDIRTGHRSDTLMKTKALNAFAMAVGRAAPGCRAEIVCLSDETVVPLQLKPAALAKRVSDLSAFVAGILKGDIHKGSPRAPALTAPPSSFAVPYRPAGSKKIFNRVPGLPN